MQVADSKSPLMTLMRRLGAAGPVAVVLSFWPAIGGLILLSFLSSLGPWLRAQQTTGMLVYFLIIGTLMGISFVPTFACAILAGWAFGFAAGLPLAMATITVGSMMAYVIGRWICRDRVIEVIAERPQWGRVYQALLGAEPRRTIFVVTLVRLPPSSPFALTNFILAAARVPWVEYAVGTIVGIGPRTAMAAYAAARLQRLQFSNVGESWMAVAGIVATVVACSVLGLMAQRALGQLKPGTQ